MWYALLIALLLVSSVLYAYDKETERVKNEIQKIISEANWNDWYKKLSDNFKPEFERIEREQKENELQWQKENQK